MSTIEATLVHKDDARLNLKRQRLRVMAQRRSEPSAYLKYQPALELGRRDAPGTE